MYLLDPSAILLSRQSRHDSSRFAGEERMQKNEHARLIDGNHNAATMDEPASGSTPLLVSIAQEEIINL